MSDGRWLWIYDPLNREVQKLAVGDGYLSGAAIQFLLGEGEILRDFRVTAESCDESQARLVLIPRRPTSYERLRVRADRASGDLLETEIVDLLGNVTRVAFEGIETNLNPAPELFRFVAPRRRRGDRAERAAPRPLRARPAADFPKRGSRLPRRSRCRKVRRGARKGQRAGVWRTLASKLRQLRRRIASRGGTSCAALLARRRALSGAARGAPLRPRGRRPTIGPAPGSRGQQVCPIGQERFAVGWFRGHLPAGERWRAVDTKSLSARLKNGKGACFREVCSLDTSTSEAPRRQHRKPSSEVVSARRVCARGPAQWALNRQHSRLLTARFQRPRALSRLPSRLLRTATRSSALRQKSSLQLSAREGRHGSCLLVHRDDAARAGGLVNEETAA